MKRNTKAKKSEKSTMTLEDSILINTSESIKRPDDRKDVLKEREPWTQRPLFETLDGYTRRVSVDIEGLPRAVVVAIKRNKALVVSPARYSKEKGGNYKTVDIPLSDGSKYTLTLTHPVCWVRAPGDRERAMLWGLRTTGQWTSASHSGDWLIMPRARSGQNAWVPKEPSKKDAKQKVAREAFRAYPVTTDGLIAYLTAELGSTVSPFTGTTRSRNSYLLFTEENHAIEKWRGDVNMQHTFQFHWEQGKIGGQKK
uniref:Uncharacterized protein n=1 Tax=viral metagenome TaxID=1070528 RepID=A0A2V0R9F5_9ZZZZ